MISRSYMLSRTAPLGLLLLPISACTIGTDFVAQPAAPPPAATLAAAGEQTAMPVADPEWWESFGDPVLNLLEARVMAGNLDLAEASARIGRARAQLRMSGADGLPKAGAAASYQRERASKNGIMALTGAGAPTADAANGGDPFGTSALPVDQGSDDFDLFQAGFDASWEIDLWGKARRRREVARAEAQASVLDREAARVSLSAEVARIYLKLRGAEERHSILRMNREAVARGEAIARQRLERGASSRYDAATAAAQVAAIDTQIPGVEQEIADTRNALALLAGAEPHALDPILTTTAETISSIRISAPLAIPSDLARNRPDIRAREAELHAATARIGVSKADFYPSLSLSGSAGLQSLTPGSLPAWDASQFVLGPIVRLPFFQGGRLKGQLELTKSDQQASAIRYRATVLKAWHEVDNALEAARAASVQVRAAQVAAEQSRIAAHVAERRYEKGAADYLTVVLAERARLEREADWVSARTTRGVAITALYKAIGGGWTPPLDEVGKAGS